MKISSTLNYVGIKYGKDTHSETTSDPIAIEQMLKISVNGSELAVLMRTPGNDEELIRGFLYTEDIFKDIDSTPVLQIKEVDKLGFTTEIDVSIKPIQLQKGYLNIRSLLSMSSCGICGKTDLVLPKGDGISKEIKHLQSQEMINGMFSKMQDNQSLFNYTGGTHAAAGFTFDGELLSIHEDIGRHNAVDKVIGDLLIKQQLKKCDVLLLSGRASYEIVSKAFIAGISTLAVVSAPSSMAIDYAKELGVILIGFCRENRMTVYS